MNVEFDEKKPLDYGYQTKKTGLVGLLVRLGLAKDESGANRLMIIVAVVCFALAVYFFMKI